MNKLFHRGMQPGDYGLVDFEEFTPQTIDDTSFLIRVPRGLSVDGLVIGSDLQVTELKGEYMSNGKTIPAYSLSKINTNFKVQPVDFSIVEKEREIKI